MFATLTLTSAGGEGGVPPSRLLQLVRDDPDPRFLVDIAGNLSCPNACPGECLPRTSPHTPALTHTGHTHTHTRTSEPAHPELRNMGTRVRQPPGCIVWGGVWSVCVWGVYHSLPVGFKRSLQPVIVTARGPCMCVCASTLWWKSTAPSKGILFTTLCGDQPPPELCMSDDPLASAACKLGTPPSCLPCPDGAYCTCLTLLALLLLAPLLWTTDAILRRTLGVSPQPPDTHHCLPGIRVSYAVADAVGAWACTRCRCLHHACGGGWRLVC